MKGGVGRIAGGGVMYATDTDHVGIPFVALLAPSEHRVRNTRLQSIMQTAVRLFRLMMSNRIDSPEPNERLRGHGLGRGHEPRLVLPILNARTHH